MHWMDLLLAVFGLIVGGAELYAIRNKVPGDTISERTRHYFRVKRENTGVGGAWAFIVLVGIFVVWFPVHILKYVAERL